MKQLSCVFALIIVLLFTGCDASQKPESTEAVTTEVNTTKSEEITTEEVSTEEVVSENEPQNIEYTYLTNLNPAGELGIVRTPPTKNYKEGYPDPVTEIPTFDPKVKSPWQVDLRYRNLTQLDLSNRLNDLLYADFDVLTQWPDQLPSDFDVDKIMALGKDPGLGVKKLHEQGITGKGVGIAIIDQTLLVDHIEYKDQLKLYEEIHNVSEYTQMHGPAVASIAVGRSVGVAPESDLYYIATTDGVYKENGDFEYDLQWFVQAVDRIIEINQSLSDDEKIRVISISLGLNNTMTNYKEAINAITRAEAENIFTVYVGQASFFGLDREPLADPNDINGFKQSRLFSVDSSYKNTIWIPMSSRCTASPTGSEDYTFYQDGGMSWTVPYVAGVYALACQVNNEMTPKLFWKTVLETSSQAPLYDTGKDGNIIAPDKLIEALRVNK